jgi:hypothetical protein
MPGDDPSINRLTGKPIATQQATDTAPAKAEAPQGFSKEYLQKAANPDRFGRFLISVEKAQELLKQMNEGVAEGSQRAVNAKGRTQREWINLVRAKFPEAKIVQSKMIDGPVHAVLPDGRKTSWSPSVTEAAIPASAPGAAVPGAAVAKPGAVKPASATAPVAKTAPATATQPVPPPPPNFGTPPSATAPAAPAAPADPIQQKIDQMQQGLLDRMGKRFGLPPGSTMDQVNAAQQAHLDKTNPAVAKQFKQQMTDIDAGKKATPIKYGPAAATTPAPPPSMPAPGATAPTAPPIPGQAAATTPATAPTAPADPSLGRDFDAGLAAANKKQSPIAIMLAQPTISGNQQLVDVIAKSLNLPAGSTVEQVLAADDAMNAKAKNKYAPAAQPVAPVAEAKKKEKEADYGDDYQDMVARVKKLAGLGPLKTVYDPAKRVYKNVPTAVQPKK